MKCSVIIVLIFVSALAKATISKNQKYHLQSRIEALLFDVNEKTTELDNRQFILSMYQQILKSTPNDIELNVMKRSLDGFGGEEPLKRSDLIEQLFVIRSEQDEIKWDYLNQNINILENIDLSKAPVNGVYGINPSEMDLDTKRERKRLSLFANNEEYQLYYGYLHAHSELSDGKGTAEEAYTMARDKAKLDFFALTDHAEMLHFWPWKRKYKKLVRVANEFNEDGVFAALYGFEWTNPIYGHINIMNTRKFVSAITKPTLKKLMKWAARKQSSFARFDHPGRVNMKIWPYEFRKLKVYDFMLEKMVAIEMFNKQNGIRRHLKKPSFMEGVNFLDNANLKGWYVGTVGGQDNHERNWGIKNDHRVGVWATGLTREKIIEAYQARRTFATEDKNASVSFKFGNNEMGSRLNQGPYTAVLRFNDLNGEQVESVKLMKNGHLVAQHPVDERQLVTIQVTAQLDDYYYVIGKQTDGDILLSSPIWIVK